MKNVTNITHFFSQATIKEEPRGNNTQNDTDQEIELHKYFSACILYSRVWDNSRRSNAVAEYNHGKTRGMVIPFEPYSITFDEIVYSVDMPQVSHFQSY